MIIDNERHLYYMTIVNIFNKHMCFCDECWSTSSGIFSYVFRQLIHQTQDKL